MEEKRGQDAERNVHSQGEIIEKDEYPLIINPLLYSPSPLVHVMYMYL